MVIEWLKFEVQPDLREQFVQQDDDIWTAVLASYSGFLGKEIWISPDEPQTVIVVIRWESFEAWQRIPSAVLENTESQFQRAMGQTYKIVDSRRYQMRKFMQDHNQNAEKMGLPCS